MTLTEFVLARLDEDDADARQTQVDLDRWNRERALNGNDGSQGSIVVVGMLGGACDPARVLAEVAAKRKIVEGYLSDDEPWDGCGDDCVWKAVEWVIRAFASVDADHPDYDPAWA